MIERPTFSEHWHRVEGLRVRLRASVQVHAQRYRGERWYVVEDPAANRFLRMSRGAQGFVGLLDGRRTVGEAWEEACGVLGDEAPTQGEAIHVLGQLYTENLLRGEVAGDARAMFDRFRKRRGRERMGRATSFLFIRVPLVDPDRFLEAIAPVFGWLFTRAGLVAWALLVAVGVAAVVREWGAFVSGAGGVLSPSNLWLLSVVFVAVKVAHELGHGVACRWFGMREGGGGEVHTMGVMMLVLAPVPYVDASSAWALRDKWHRIVVGGAGMVVELGIAAVAAMVWASASEGVVRAVALNVVFIAGVSTLLFNANPLLRYDGYYMLSDWLEIANLGSRSKRQVRHVVERWVWGSRASRSPAHSLGEAWMLGVYGVASGVYRVFVSVVIVLFVAGQLFFVGVVLAVGAVAVMLVAPAVRFAHHVLTSAELSRVRGRAVATSVAFVGGAVGVVALVPAPDRVIVGGVVEARVREGVFAREAGFVESATAGGGVEAGAVLVRLGSVELETDREAAAAALRGAEVRYSSALAEDAAAAVIRREEVRAREERLASLDERADGLMVRARSDGRWVCPACDELEGRYVERGMRLGEVVGGGLRVRAVVGQRFVASLVGEGAPAVAVRARGRGWETLAGEAGSASPAGGTALVSEALADRAGGGVAVDESGDGAVRARESLFEIPVEVPGAEAAGWRVGQRVSVRFELEPKPIGAQVVRAVRQVLQGRRGVGS